MIPLSITSGIDCMATGKLKAILSKVPIFGDDGFRSRFGETYMTPYFLTAFSEAVADIYKNENGKKPLWISGDTRASGDIVLQHIGSVWKKREIPFFSTGILPTPAFSWLLPRQDCHMGIMITASHNPASDNGIKLFQPNGYKLESNIERKIEARIRDYFETLSEEIEFSKTEYEEKNIVEEYVTHLNKSINVTHLPYKILIDCSHGACSSIAAKLFNRFRNVKVINNKPDGYNINEHCGALEIQHLFNKMQKEGCDYGIAFDGDGDRAVFVEKNYGEIEGEKILCLFAEMEKIKNEPSLVISTEICNRGLEFNLQNVGLKLMETKVGDRNVTHAVLDHQALMGAEPSGHYFFPNTAFSMDGLQSACRFLRLLEQAGKALLERLGSLQHFKRIKKNIFCKNSDCELLGKILTEALSILRPEKEKFLIRESMWDSVIRVYYDYQSENRYPLFENLVSRYLKTGEGF